MECEARLRAAITTTGSPPSAGARPGPPGGVRLVGAVLRLRASAYISDHRPGRSA